MHCHTATHSRFLLHTSTLHTCRFVNKLVSYKFEYVVTPQTYGKNRDSSDVRLRWLAESMNVMLQR
jgi:hypothetical protein